MNNVKQYFEILTNETHKGRRVLIRVHHRDEDKKVWEDWGGRIYNVESEDYIIVELGEGGTLIRMERDAVKLID